MRNGSTKCERVNPRIHLHKNELDVSEKQLMTLLRASRLPTKGLRTLSMQG